MNELDFTELDRVINVSVPDLSLSFDEPEKAPDQRDRIMPGIVCKDGVTLSVQASNHHYCSPRTNDAPWSTVEVGFPSVVPPQAWEQYADEWSDPKGTVYGYIPVELVREFIKLHGGEDAEEIKALRETRQ